MSQDTPHPLSLKKTLFCWNEDITELKPELFYSPNEL